MAEEKKFERFRCPGCSADMDFDPETGQMKCRFCGHTEAVPAQPGAAAPPHSLDEFLAKIDDAHLRPFTDEALQVSCDGCGSMVVFQPPEVAGSCPFCGAAMVTQPKAADPLIAPDGILPAKVPKNNAQTEVREWIQTRWFAPSALKRLAQQEGISGVYLPFWDYAAATSSRYQVELPAGFEKAKSVMQEVIDGDVRNNIGGNEQRVDSIDTEYSNATFRHLLLPVWIGAYRFQGKVYQVLVNARTGEVQGERPYSVWKIALLVAVVLLVLWVVRVFVRK